jgi:hypothetical protein
LEIVTFAGYFQILSGVSFMLLFDQTSSRCPNKLGRKTGRFSFAEKFLLLFSFSVLRPKTNVSKKIFVVAYGRNQDQIVLRK